jgi:hypothetical protein
MLHLSLACNFPNEKLADCPAAGPGDNQRPHTTCNSCCNTELALNPQIALMTLICSMQSPSVSLLVCDEHSDQACTTRAQAHCKMRESFPCALLIAGHG